MVAPLVLAAGIGAAGSIASSLMNRGGGRGGQFVLSDEERALLQERAQNQALLRRFATGGNTYNPFQDLKVRENLEARLGRGQATAFKQGVNALNAAGGATTGQMTHLQKTLNDDFLNRLGEQEEKIQFAGAGHQAQTQLAGISGISGGPAPTPTYIADSPREDAVGRALGSLASAGVNYFGQQAQAKSDDARFDKYLAAMNRRNQAAPGTSPYTVNFGGQSYSGSY